MEEMVHLIICMSDYLMMFGVDNMAKLLIALVVIYIKYLKMK